MVRINNFIFIGRLDIVEKGGNGDNQHFLLFLQCFQKHYALGIVWYTVDTSPLPVSHHMIYPLPNDKISDTSKLKHLQTTTSM